MEMTVKEAAEAYPCTKNYLHKTIRDGKLPSALKGKIRIIKMRDLAEYKENRWKRSRSKYKDRLIFDKDKGLYSVTEASNIIKIPPQNIYYAIRSGKLRSNRVRSYFVIHLDDIIEYKTHMKIGNKGNWK